MLRRTETIVLKDEPAETDALPRTAPQRRGLSALRPEAAQAQPLPLAESEPMPQPAAPSADDATMRRWREEIEQQPQMSPEHRRNIDRWRAEVLQSVAASDDDDPAPSRWRHLVKPTNIALLALALIAGGAAAYLASQQGTPPSSPAVVAETAAAPVTQVIEEAKVQVLVAKTAIGVGQRLSPATVEWVEWPEDTTRPDFVLQTAVPDALDTMSGAVARYEFFPGEPIREIKLARADHGLLSAVLDPGTRGVSVSVNAESASGGFILPNDRVDVVLTTIVGTKQASSTILRNVRVLAINSQIGETAATKPKTEKNSGASDNPDQKEADAGPGTFSSAIATLALTPQQSEVIISATLNGRLSLVLRPTADVADSFTADDHERATNEAIRISSPFWTK